MEWKVPHFLLCAGSPSPVRIGFEFIGNSNKARAWGSLFFAVVWTTWEARNQLIFKGLKVDITKSVDTVQFRLVWGFKHMGTGLSEDITTIMLNLSDRCMDPKPLKLMKAEVWQPLSPVSLKFNVDGSAKGSPGQAGMGGVLRNNNAKHPTYNPTIFILTHVAADVSLGE